MNRAFIALPLFALAAVAVLGIALELPTETSVAATPEVEKVRATVASTSADGAWGSLKGRFVYDGKVKREKIVPNKDPEFCGKHEVFSEDIVVGKKGGLANLLMFLSLKTGQKVKIHKDKQKLLKEKVLIDNKGCRFEPHVNFLWIGQEIEVKNSDAVPHNTNVKFISRANRGYSFNELVPGNDSMTKKIAFKKPERVPAPVGCNIHPWMGAHLLVLDHPYAAVSAEDGTFEITNIPTGEFEFILWHEAVGYVGNLTLGKSKAKTSKRGRVTLNIKGGEMDFGDIKITPKQLQD